MSLDGGRRPVGRLRRLFRRFRRDDKGATAVEFAMVSVPFLGLMFAIFETAFVFFVTEGIEAATADAARMIMTGQALSSNYASATSFRDAVICSPTSPRVRVLPDFIDCSALIVDVSTAGSTGSTSFGSADLSKSYYTNPQTKYCVGAPGDVVVVRVVYPMPVYLSILTATNLGSVSVSTSGLTSFGGGLKHMLMGTAAFRNEPFQGTYTAPTGC